jgi:hypothetical protein
MGLGISPARAHRQSVHLLTLSARLSSFALINIACPLQFEGRPAWHMGAGLSRRTLLLIPLAQKHFSPLIVERAHKGANATSLIHIILEKSCA